MNDEIISNKIISNKIISSKIISSKIISSKIISSKIISSKIRCAVVGMAVSMTAVRSPLRYPGGKSNALDRIIPLIPDFSEYIEPFLGGGHIFLAVKQRFGNDKKYWINDLYYELYNFWKMCQGHADEMIDILRKWKNDYRDGRLLRQHIKINNYKFDEIERASAYLAKNMTSFSGFEYGFSEYNYEKIFTMKNIELLDDVCNILKGVKITNLDYQRVIESLIEDRDGMGRVNGVKEERVFIMLDPPYFNASSDRLYGKDGDLHRYFDHQRFANVMRECSETTKFKWLITYDDSNTVRRLFNWANIVSWELKYISRSPKMGKEVFISNYDILKTKGVQMDIESAWCDM